MNQQRLCVRYPLPMICSVFVMLATPSYGADAVVDRSASAAKGKMLVDAHCRRCHSGVWEDETYESIHKLLKEMDVGDVTHRFKIRQLKAEEMKQVAAYWTPKPSVKPTQSSATKSKSVVTIE